MVTTQMETVPGLAPRRRPLGPTVMSRMTSSDHTTVGRLYLVTSFLFFALGGVMAQLVRAGLLDPGLQVIQGAEQYHQSVPMHGATLVLLFATPLFLGFANVIVPPQIGASGVAFPRLNLLGYRLYLLGGLIAAAGFFTPQGAASFGWFAYAPLSDTALAPGLEGDLWVVGLAIAVLGMILGAVNLITTIVTMRAPGMTMFRMPIFTWNTLLTSVLVLMAFPPLASALCTLGADRLLGAQIFNPAEVGAIPWQHLFWFFGRPGVYVVALPFLGIVSEILPVFSRKAMVGHKGLVCAAIAIAALSVMVWAHDMYPAGAVLEPFFAFVTTLIAFPAGVMLVSWIGTMWRGRLTFETPMLWTIGLLTTLLFGGLTGVLLSSPALDFRLSDSSSLVAHSHYVVFGVVVFAMFAGFYFWWPRLTGRMLDERLGRIHFWLLFVGFDTTFLIQHWLVGMGTPRRSADYLPQDAFAFVGQISALGSVVLGVSTLPFLWNVYTTWRSAPRVTVDDPWGYAASLESATSAPRDELIPVGREDAAEPEPTTAELALISQAPVDHGESVERSLTEELFELGDEEVDR